MVVKNVIFDLGGVVFDWNPDLILQNFYPDVGLRAAMRAALFQHPDWLQLDSGTLTETEVVARLEAETSRGNAEFTALFEAIRNSLQPKPATLALIDKLARRLVPLYCLSNMSVTTFAYLRERHRFWSLFRGIVISGEIKMIKPDLAIFRYILDRFSLAPSNTVFVDDHPPNIAAARQLGLHTVLFLSPEQCAFELEALLRPD